MRDIIEASPEVVDDVVEFILESNKPLSTKALINHFRNRYSPKLIRALVCGLIYDQFIQYTNKETVLTFKKRVN